ncbi:MAG: DUF1289 domain-containing protein [Betaproteobacteria bacterium]|nr:DUF1289 domain-containing protein [Betaproteobacteria bacterium]
MNPAALLKQEPEVASPCVNVCRMDTASGFCEGCHRSLEEIASWSEYTAAEKRAVLALLTARKPAL